jgi:hypothetical protein
VDPIQNRHGILGGEPAVVVPERVKEHGERIARGEDVPKVSRSSAPTAPMPQAAAAFVEIISKSNVLRSQHAAYRQDRARRLAFCSILRAEFGIVDDAALTQSFHSACVGHNDTNGEHDAQQALAWAMRASSAGPRFSMRKLLCDASAVLHEAGDVEMGRRAARLANFFLKRETNAA